MGMRFSCSDYTFPLLEHDKALDVISLMEFEGVDIGLFEGRSRLQPSTMFENITGNARILKKKLLDRNLKLADIFLQTATNFTTTALNHPDKSIRDMSRGLFLKTLEFICECEGSHMTVLPGALFDNEPEQLSFDRCCKELLWRCEEAQKYGIALSIEAHLGSIVPMPGDTLKLLHNVPGLTLTLDYSHFIKQGASDEQVEPLIEHASHFHARGACKGKLQASAAENSINFEHIAAVMKDTGYGGFICIEYTWDEWENCNRVDNISETILLLNKIKKNF